MNITIDELLKGKSTNIKGNNYFPTAGYIEPFLERMSKFTTDFRVQVKLPDQITRESDGKEDLTYNRVLVEAVLPNDMIWDNHDEVIGLVYGLDVRKPVVKIYRGGLNRACTNLCVFDPSFLNVQELEPEKAIDFRPVTNLLEQTSDLNLWLKQLNDTEWEQTPANIEANLGKWVRNSILESYNDGYGKVKLATSNVVDAYKSMFLDDKSDYYIQPNSPVNMFTVYNAFTELISNDKGKDLMNKAEKTLLLRQILDF